MAYDRELAARVRDVLAERAPAREKSMFGGLGFLVDDAMAVCTSSDGDLLVRVPPDDQAGLVAAGGVHVAPMAMGTRRSRTWVHVAPAALTSYDDLAGWVDRGLATVRGLAASGG